MTTDPTMADWPPRPSAPSGAGRAHANNVPGWGRARGRSGTPAISWALVLAGLLGGGVLSFGAGVITGTQMTTVAYRGALPDATGPERTPEASAARPSPPRKSLPRERQVAATPDPSGSATPGTEASAGADAPASPATPVSPADSASSAGPDGADVAWLVNLPPRTHWQERSRGQAGQDAGTEAGSEPSRAGALKRAAPPPPLPKPDGLAPQRLTPMGGTEGSGSVSGQAAKRPPAAALATPIWRIAAPNDVSAMPVGYDLFTAGLTPSANWAPSADQVPSADGSRAHDDGRTPQSDPRAQRQAAPAAEAAAPAGRYSVQVGAFRDPANASAQAARLSAAGYTPRIVHAQATQSRLYMVRLGAFHDRSAARAYAGQIAERLDIDTWPVAN